MVIFREKGILGLSRNLLLRTAVCDTFSTHTVPPLYEIKTFERDMKIQKMVHITNIPG